MLQESQHPVVIDSVEITSNIRIEYPANLLETNSDGQKVERNMRLPSRSEPVGEAEKIRLVDGVEHLRHSPLDNFVLDSRHGDFILHLTQQAFEKLVPFAFYVNALRDHVAPVTWFHRR